MDIRTLLFAALAAGPATALAASSPTASLGDAVAQLESRYPGKVVAIALDDSGDRPAHYHVDMRFAASGLARLDVDPATLDIASREPTPLAEGSGTLFYGALMAAQAIPGQLLAVELDATNGAPAHYDVDLRLQTGGVARLKVDPVSGKIAWRTPAVAVD